MQQHSTSASTDTPDAEARFHVIIHGPKEDDEAEFKTRGKHAVKKVIATACKTFGLDYTKYDYTLRVHNSSLTVYATTCRAHLVFSQVIDGEEQWFECDPEQTMGIYAVKSGSKFVIFMDGEGEDELDELNGN